MDGLTDEEPTLLVVEAELELTTIGTGRALGSEGSASEESLGLPK